MCRCCRPVEVSIDNRLDVCGALVLPVKVIGMFPDVDYEEWLYTRLATRRFGVGRRFDDELAVLLKKPRPAASEALHRRIGKRDLAGVERAEGRVDRRKKFRRRLATLPGRRERPPVEVVVPDLRRVVEYCRIARVAGCSDYLFEGEPFVFCSRVFT